MSHPNLDELTRTNADLRARVTELEDTLAAIRSGQVDALVIDTDEGEKIYSLTSAETTYRILIEQMNEGAAMLSPDGMVLYCNQRFAEIIKTPMDSVVGSQLVQLFDRRQRAKFDNLFGAGLTQPAQQDFAWPAASAAGQPKHYLFSVAPFNPELDAGLPTTANVSLIVTDISGIKNLEQQLRDHQKNLERVVEERTRELEKTNKALNESRQAALVMMEDALETARHLQESEEKYRQLIEQSSDAIYLFHDQRFEIVNRKFCAIFSTTPEEAASPDFNLLAFVTKESKPVIEKYFSQIETGITAEATFEFAIRTPDDKTLTLEASVSTIKYKRDYAIQGILRDITERKELQAQLYQSQKMEAIGQLAGGVAHDFNNILTVISGYSELLLNRVPHDSPHLNALHQIRESGRRAASLTRQLLAFSRKQILEPQNINLNGLITNLEKMLGRLIGEDVFLTTYLAADLGTIRADPGQIEQVIVNLAVNARDAMPRGGKLTFETDNIYLNEAYCKRHQETKPGHFVVMTISDNGVGMDKTTLDHIFEPFFTTKSKDKGTGLGLATVYGIVKQSGGNIWVYSEPGQGSVFKIYFPAVEEFASVSAQKAGIFEKLQGSETILVVEDEEAVLDFLEQSLQEFGYHLIIAHDGLDAISKAKEFTGTIHLLLTDVVMPNMSGKNLSLAIEKLRPDTKICFMSGYTNNAIVHHGILDQNINFIQKPFTPDDLLKKIRGILDTPPPKGSG